MIDIHCHILPDIDDGASSLEEALEMARMAARTGVTDIIATPHFRGEADYLDMRPEIDRQYAQFKDALERWNVPIRLHQGAEILCLPQTPELAAMQALPTLGNTRYVLTEFHFDESFGYMDDCLREIAAFGYDPVVAHPERYDAVYRDPRRLRAWAERGYVLQLNKGSILGSLGSHAEQSANELLELGLAHLFASDAHGCYNRTPHMEGLLRWAEECCEPDCAHILLEENPRRVLNGLPPAVPEELFFPQTDDPFDFPSL